MDFDKSQPPHSPSNTQAISQTQDWSQYSTSPPPPYNDNELYS